MRFIFYLLLLLSLNISISYSLPQQRDTVRNRYGIYGHYNYNMHIADFNKLPGVPNCCPSFTEGTGTGYTLGLLYEFILGERFSIDLRGSISSLDGKLIKKEPTTIILDGKHQPGEFEHDLWGNITTIGAEPLLSFRIFSGLKFHLGMRAALTSRADYRQIEQISNPADRGTFLDDKLNDSFSRTRNASAGKIPNAESFLLHGLAGLSWEFPLNRSLNYIIAPEIFYAYGFGNLSSVDWKVNQLRIGLALKYFPLVPTDYKILRYRFDKVDTITIKGDEVAESRFSKGLELSWADSVYDPETYTSTVTLNTQRRDTIYISTKYTLKARLRLTGLDSLGKEIPSPRLYVNTYVSAKVRPLLNYVFFDENSAVIPLRYNFLTSASKDSFLVERLYNLETMELYYHVMNIIGRRMLNYPTAKLKIVGCNSDLDVEEGAMALSLKRAEAVYDYYRNVWNLPAERLSIEVRNLSAKPSLPKIEADKIIENRRVELQSDEFEIIAPVFTYDTIYYCSPGRILLNPQAEASEGLSGWNIDVTQLGKPIKSFIGRAIISDTIWNLLKDVVLIPDKAKPIEAVLTVRDKKGHITLSAGQELSLSHSSTLRHRGAEIIDSFEVDKYSLILFDFDKPTIESTNKMICDYIRSNIRENALIDIEGYTDRTGEEEHNMQLSISRANATARVINRPRTAIKGYGEQIRLFDNDLPEGRFYNRTVNITVKTPLSK